MTERLGVGDVLLQIIEDSLVKVDSPVDRVRAVGSQVLASRAS